MLGTLVLVGVWFYASQGEQPVRVAVAKTPSPQLIGVGAPANALLDAPCAKHLDKAPLAVDPQKIQAVLDRDQQK